MGDVEELLGSQEPTHKLVPAYDRTFGPSLQAVAEEFGYTLDPSQVDVLTDGTGLREDGSWAASEVVDIESRQNGKSVKAEVLILWALFVARAERVLYTAHQAATAKDIFARVREAIERSPEFQDELMPDRSGGIRIANGEWQITLASGQFVAFRTRTKSGGRGLTRIKLLIIDEVQDYTDEQQGALEPTISAVADPQVWYFGSAGGKHSEVLARLWHRFVQGSDNLVYYGWHASEDDDPADERVWARVNPAYGRRISRANIAREHENWSALRFARERLGIADYPRAEGEDWVIPRVAFERVCDPDVAIRGDVIVLVPETTPDMTWSSISAGGRTEDGRIAMELLEHDRGSKWLRPVLQEIVKKNTTATTRVVIAVDPKGPAGFVSEELAVDGTKVLDITHEHIAEAFAWLSREAPVDPPDGWAPAVAVREAKEITAALAAAQVRRLGSRWTWQRHTSEDVTPIISANLAGWMTTVAEREKKDPPPSPVRAPGRTRTRPTRPGAAGDLRTARF